MRQIMPRQLELVAHYEIVLETLLDVTSIPESDDSYLMQRIKIF